MSTRTRNLEDILNRMNPGASYVELGTLLKDLIEAHNALLAKLDADEGVTDADYADSLSLAALSDR